MYALSTALEAWAVARRLISIAATAIFILSVGMAANAQQSSKPEISAQRSSLRSVRPVDRHALFAATPSSAQRAASEIQAEVDKIIEGLNRRDVSIFRAYYLDGPDPSFFGPLSTFSVDSSLSALSKTLYMSRLQDCLAMFSSVEVKPNSDIDIRIGDRVAIWTATGTNHLTFREGTQSKTNWRWTIMFERTVDGRWYVTHEHTSFERAN
jgi:ketosteroid isomerase-like protein